MDGEHTYNLTIRWTGNTGTGTENYNAYERCHIVSAVGKPDILGSADLAFRGDKTKYNPEDLLVASLSACHMLTYLHLCAVSGIIVTDYIDNARGTMIHSPNGGGSFKEVTLNPIATITDKSMEKKARELHTKANELCFIANSVSFPVNHNPNCKIKAND